MHSSVPRDNKGAYIVVSVDQEIERARLIQQRQEGDAARDLADDVLDLLRNGLLGLPRLLSGIAVKKKDKKKDKSTRWVKAFKQGRAK